jgi:hypothetical protein
LQHNPLPVCNCTRVKLHCSTTLLIAQECNYIAGQRFTNMPVTHRYSYALM